GSEAYSESILVEMLFARQRPIGPMPQILIVPKDIDALMAVGFDLATAALTSKSCLDMLITINPRLHEKLNVIEISQTFLHPLVTTIEVGGDLPGEARDFFEGMANTTEGRRCLDVIGLDNWKKLSQADWELLGQPEKGN
ncbi:MAG: phosphate/phosphite/phosphonate ABC transporter substrate-binding protein, partial [Proteobacteria bacterium]|nr:phosphate/phosphite/phosphonate ABC transporter substrate-binding protein [Pseudomonadota bacterium]